MIGSIDAINHALGQTLVDLAPDNVVIITSQTASNLAVPELFVLETYPQIVVPDGENCKYFSMVDMAYSHMLSSNVTRKSLIVAVGGGTVLDLAGFCAATFMRGIPIIYVPTTLLSMVDSAEGGKTGVNFRDTKNLIGVFYPAKAIFTSPHFLKTLPPIELKAGWAEMLKHALLQGEEACKLLAHGMPDCDQQERWQSLIEANILFKRSIVEIDFNEQGPRKLLNLGHTFAHALESLYLKDKSVNHGICVANGLYWETVLSAEIGFCDPALIATVETMIFPAFPKLALAPSQIAEMIQLIQVDKKNAYGKLNFTLLKEIGQAHFDVVVSKEQVEQVLSVWANQTVV